MATRIAQKRLAKEYKSITANPPPYITAHPSDANILEWHYIITGPPSTPYESGQYWGTLLFPANYPYAPPAIRMHTPSGRFQPSERLCLSISDFHPKSFNPAWEVSTILIGLLSFMTGEEMTTGSVGASAAERRVFAQRSRWWNSTGGGSTSRRIEGVSPDTSAAAAGKSSGRGVGSIKAGDGGAKFRAEWPEVDAENWKYLTEQRIDPQTGMRVPPPGENCSQGASAITQGLPALRNTSGAMGQARDAGQSWIRRNKFMVSGVVLVVYVLLARLLREE